MSSEEELLEVGIKDAKRARVSGNAQLGISSIAVLVLGWGASKADSLTAKLEHNTGAVTSNTIQVEALRRDLNKLETRMEKFDERLRADERTR